jgi:thioredoxin reductase (NADPH)
MAEPYDMVIIGGGPAGLTAGLYASRSRLKTLLLERGLFGGQIVNATKVENFPGFPRGISGTELGELMHRQASAFGLETRQAEVTGVELGGEIREVHTDHGSYQARALVIASGSEHRKLSVPGEERLLGRGVSYCATCDAPFYQGKEVAVVGGGDTAITDALYLARFASRIYVVHRRRELRAVALLQERAFAEPRLSFIWDSVVEEVLGGEEVKGLRLRDVKTGQSSRLEVQGVFVAIGQEPNTAFLKGKLKLTPTGHIPTDGRMETALPGVFAAGDVCQDSARQAVTAAGDGATATMAALAFLRS